MPEIWILLLAFGASARLTRLITRDTITEFIRDWIEDRYGEDSFAREFIGCPWCVGFWVSGFVTALAFCPPIAHHPIFMVTATALSISWLYALIAVNLDRH